jgi:hypothetical protein
MESMVMKNIFLLLLLLSAGFIKAQQFYVDPVKGKDINAGSKSDPLKTIMEAAKRINSTNSKGAAEIILKEGIHIITETALFNNDRFSNSDRLIIRAEIMPDDATWKPFLMPVIISLVPLVAHDQFGEEAYGLQVEVSHVTIAGIKFTGSPDYTFPSDSSSRRTYPIWRGGNALDDLLVTQCLFVGDQFVLPLHVGIIANGHGLVVDHCVFYNCKNPVVFWRAEGKMSHHDAMRYCLVYGAYFSGIWTVEQGEDFECHHNIFANCEAAWVRENHSQRKYQVHDCLFANNKVLTAYGGAKTPTPTPSDFLNFTNTRTEGAVKIEMDQSKRNYLQLAEGSDGREIGAGLFKQ